MEPEDDKTQTHVVLTTGTMVGHYRIIEKIGSGGMGEVYLAEDTKLHREVALKFLPQSLVADQEAKARFTREAQAAAALKHPNIVTIHEVSEFHGSPFFAMECCEGQPLRDLIADARLSLEHIVDLAIQIAEGLQEAHEAGIVHRDVKPSNIILDKKGRPKLLDFGLAAVKGADHLTKTGSTLGTVFYMSPEQISGKEVDHRTDLFSLGVILYELIALRRPFTGDNDAAIINAVVCETPQPLARYCADVPNELQRIVTKLLEKDKAFRYQSAAEVVSDLKQFRSMDTRRAVSSRLTTRRRLMFIGLPALVVLILILSLSTRLYLPTTEEPEAKKPMLAVLPFENLGHPEDEYFADGITDEIISRLAALHDLGVISRTSTLQYKRTTKNIRDIGLELGADYILEGTIRWDKSSAESRVRINPQLIHAADDVHLWADRYDAVIDDIFAVQTSIAEQVVRALGVTLLESEEQALRSRPTKNTEAYDYYLRGLNYTTTLEKDLRNAEMLLHRAVELAPDFALAYAELGYVHTQMYWFYHDRTEQRIAAAREAIDRAFAIDPDLPEAHGALGWYYYHGFLDYDRALKEFCIQREMQPSNSRAVYSIALIERRQSKWEDAVKSFTRAFQLDPHSIRVCSEYGTTLVLLRRYAEAETYYDRTLALAPDAEGVYRDKAWILIQWKGDTEGARRILQDAMKRINRNRRFTYMETNVDIIEGDYVRALDRLADLGAITGFDVRDSIEYYNLKGDVYRLSNDSTSMAACYDSAYSILKRVGPADADDFMYHADLSWALSGLGRNQEAIREARRATEILPVAKDAISGTSLVENLAIAYIMAGEHDLAIEQLEYLLSIPSELSVPYLKIWPDFAPLRDHPRFKTLMEKYGGENET